MKEYLAVATLPDVQVEADWNAEFQPETSALFVRCHLRIVETGTSTLAAEAVFENLGARLAVQDAEGALALFHLVAPAESTQQDPPGVSSSVTLLLQTHGFNPVTMGRRVAVHFSGGVRRRAATGTFFSQSELDTTPQAAP